MKYDLVIKNGLIYDIDKDSYTKCDIAIKDNIIKKISANLDADRVIDAQNCIIMPGFINTHIHFGEYYVKGYSGKMNTYEYIKYADKINLDNKEYLEEIRTTSSIICAFKACEYGQTTLIGIRGWDCLEKYKFRLYMGYPLMNSKKLGKYLDDPYTNFEKYQKDNLNEYYFFIHSLLTVDENIISSLAKYLENKNIKVAVHVSETRKENKLIKEKYGLTPIQVLEKYNLLNSNTLLVHCCYITDNDIEIIKKHNCTISINPLSNIRLGNKIPNINKFKGINVCIGTDGIASSDSLNIISSCHILGLKYNISNKDLLNMLTLNPAKYLNKDIGRVKEGYLADILVYELDNINVVRKDTFIHDLLYTNEVKPRDIIIDGKIMFSNYKNVQISKSEMLKLNISNKLKYQQKSVDK